MTDRELLQEILATYLVFEEMPVYIFKTLGLLFSYRLRTYLIYSKYSNEETAWKNLESCLRYNERNEFFAKVRIAYLKGEYNG